MQRHQGCPSSYTIWSSRAKASTTQVHSTHAGKAEGPNTCRQHKTDMHVFTYVIVSSLQVMCSLSDVVSPMSVCRADMSGGPCRCICGSSPERQQAGGPALHQRSEQRDWTGTASSVDCPTLLSAVSLPSARCVHALLSPLQHQCAVHFTSSGSHGGALPWNSVGDMVHDLLPSPACCPKRLAEVQYHHPGAMLLLVDGPGCKRHPQSLS